MEIPVCLNSGYFRVVVVEAIVSGADKLLGDSVADENAEHFVLDGVGLILIKSDEDEGVVHEVLVLEERRQEGAKPDTCDSDGCVMAVAGHVGGDKHPLRQLIVLQVFEEKCCVLNLLQTVLLVGDGIEQDFWASTVRQNQSHGNPR